LSKNTVENIVKKVRDHFELVMLCAQRAKDLFAGARPTIDKHDNKNTVVAVLEMEADKLDTNELKEELILSNQVNVPIASEQSDDDSLLEVEREIKGEIFTSDIQDSPDLGLEISDSDSGEDQEANR